MASFHIRAFTDTTCVPVRWQLWFPCLRAVGLHFRHTQWAPFTDLQLLCFHSSRPENGSGGSRPSRSCCAHFGLEFTRLHVCLSVCKSLFWDLEHPLPPTLAAGQMNAAAELQHRPLDASASRLTCAFQLLGCVCGSTSPWHGRHGSSEPEKGSLSCPPARLSLQTEDWSMKGEPRRLWLCCISRTNPRRLCAVDLAVGRDRRAARLILQGLCLRLCVYVVMREREVNQGYPSACPPGGSGRHAAHLGAGGCTVGGVPGGVCRSPLSSSTCRSPLGGPEPGVSGGRL